MLTIELDYENSKEKLIKSFNKKNPRKEFLSGDIYLESVSKFNFYLLPRRLYFKQKQLNTQLFFNRFDFSIGRCIGCIVIGIVIHLDTTHFDIEFDFRFCEYRFGDSVRIIL